MTTRLLSIAWPIAGIFVMTLLAVVGGDLAAHREVSLNGETWRLPIQGFDPRDPIYGHYVAFRFDLPPSEDGICLEGDPTAPTVTPLQPGQACTGGQLPPTLLTDTHRYLVPQTAGPAIEALLRNPDVHAEVEVSNQLTGGVRFGRLFIDGQSWEPAE